MHRSVRNNTNAKQNAAQSDSTTAACALNQTERTTRNTPKVVNRMSGDPSENMSMLPAKCLSDAEENRWDYAQA